MQANENQSRYVSWNEQQSTNMGAGRIFLQGWAIRGSEGPKSPSRVQGQLPCGDLGAKPQKLTTFCQNDATFSGGGEVPPCPCLREPMSIHVTHFLHQASFTLSLFTFTFHLVTLTKFLNKITVSHGKGGCREGGVSCR